MRILLLCLILTSSCTKPNPNRCCTSEADCAAANLPVGMTCGDDKVCRGNVCVVESCSSATECDLAAPYCSGAPRGVCQEQCSADTECPGSGQNSALHLCDVGACVECRTAGECSPATPTCSNGRCVACVENAQCGSGICTSTGTCASPTDIAYVDVTGSPSSDCTTTTPCSAVERALSLLPARPYILISPGTYTRTGPLVVPDRRFLIGRGTPRPAIDRVDDGPIITMQGASDVHLQALQLSGATGAPGNEGMPLDGYAIYCRTAGGSPAVSLNDVVVTNNARGIAARQCKIDISRSVFSTGYALEFTDVIARVDRSTFDNSYVNLDGGLFTFTNNVLARNPGGLALYSTQAGNVIEFNTFIDTAFSCGNQVATAFPNNIFARSGSPGGATCSFPGSIIAPTDVTALKFKHPDSAPYDYHLLPGSSAIDTAVSSTMDHDIDGDSRPKGAGRDVGADEAQ